MPASHPSSSLACSSAAGNSRPSRRHSPYAPPPRKSSYAPDPALATLGAFYVSWPKGKRDPAPLCCPVAKGALVKRFGEAQVGWMTAPPPQPVPQPQPRPQVPLLAGMALPPLPPLPSSQAPSSSSSVSPPAAFSYSAPIPPAATTSTPPDFSFSASTPLATTSTHGALTSSSPGNACALLEEALRLDRASSFDETTTLSLSLPYSSYGSSSGGNALDISSRPPSPSPEEASKPLLLNRLPPIPEIKVEDEEDDFAANEGLWSAGEDGGLLYHGTDVESEASWAW
ncbi:hypothetical protein JCM6882_005849 [Rhodosporidiobolus microsporus]